jgi:hypothetical protein
MWTHNPVPRRKASGRQIHSGRQVSAVGLLAVLDWREPVVSTAMRKLLNTDLIPVLVMTESGLQVQQQTVGAANVPMDEGNAVGRPTSMTPLCSRGS